MRQPLRRLSLAALVPLGMLAPPSAAAAPQPSPAAAPGSLLPRLSGTVTLDGVPDEEAWSRARVVERFWENVPGETTTPPVETVGLLAYDSDYLYVGIRCADPEPAKLRAPWVERDRVLDQDFVQVEVDARDEGRWEMIFRVNPHGVQADGIFDEAVGADDFSPDFHWESATRIGADGWTVEMRIPLSTLRYPEGDPQTWRISFFRLYPRKYRYQIASMPIPRGSNCWTCHMPRFTGIHGLGRADDLTVAPFVTAGANDGDGGDGDASFAGGADLKWLPAPNLAVDAALDPDFSQVEADSPQIAVNNRFALFYPEKRPFFLEGSDLWNSPIAAIHTRTITEPDWGLRLTGRPGSASYTLLAAGDDGDGTLILPGPVTSGSTSQPGDASVFLGRYRQTFGRSSLGALATSREGDGGYFNRLGGMDFQWYPTASDRFVGQLLWSSTRDPGATSADDEAYYLRWERSQRRFSGWLQLDELGREFRADSGFVPQTGVRHGQAYAEYNFYPHGSVRRIWPRLHHDESRALGDEVVSQSSALGIGVDGRAQAILDWYFRERQRAVDGQIFETSYWNLSARFLPSRRVPLVTLAARWGDALDLAGSRLGTGADLTLGANFHATDRLQAELTGQQRWLDVPEGGREIRLFTATVARARLTYAFTARSFTRLIGEWMSLDESGAGGESTTSFSGSALYGYRLDWQSILYVGYDNRAAETSGGDRVQELFVKVGYAFRPRLRDARRESSPPPPSPRPAESRAPESSAADAEAPFPVPAMLRVLAAGPPFAWLRAISAALDAEGFEARENPPRWYGVCPIEP